MAGAAAALEWLTSQSLGTTAVAAMTMGDSPEASVWNACNESMAFIRRRTGVAGEVMAAEQLLAWIVESGQDKTVLPARVGAFRLLVSAILHSPVCSFALYMHMKIYTDESPQNLTNLWPPRRLSCPAFSKKFARRCVRE